ncbi:hypothetical protein G647_05529 [Cladophialophora carrionii CBS 160.54]|uniref:Arylsulfotransferase N-terminal domain-containing protein n=1 Tax=Cladophialophora carrionii CBS 160.54 TaxID=1279043 RepID=V9D9X2_9EURO|nr:uncharacterized protein G647_05529 [Cladophialophora carrionii CBS 160.54]ETI23724.1 hypothetical protein G647_05529 [Cladophialophora carrionii CBS 160.54]
MTILLRQILALALYIVLLINVSGAQQPSSPPWSTLSFKSAPTISPLSLEINKTGQTAPGYLFLNPTGFAHINSTAPVVFTDDNELVWFGPRGQAFNFGPYEYQGKTVLAYWNGSVFPEPVGRGYGSIVLLDSSYETLATVSLPGRFLTLNASQTFPGNIDLHEINITPQDTILVTANNVTQHDLSSVGGPNPGWTVDSIIYEIDIASNEIIFEWHALDHLDRLPFSTSQLPRGSEGYNGTTQATAWNYFHINAVSQLNGEEGYIISSRYLCSEIAVEKRSGNVLWVLSGIDGGDFQLAANATFCYQHDVRQRQSHRHGRNREIVIISLFDNANSPLTLPNPTAPSSGLILSLDVEAKTAIAVARYENPNLPIYATAQGNLQFLPGGHKMVGYGFAPLMQEFNQQGESVMTAQFGPMANGMPTPTGGVLGYRDFRGHWTGCPQTPPDVYAEREGNSGVRAYMSWNGNTEYKSWTVFAGSPPSGLRAMSTVERSGFETSFLIPQNVSYVQVQAQAQAQGTAACKYTRAQTLSRVVTVS